MISYLRKNLISIMIGCIIGLPFSLYAVSEREPPAISHMCYNAEIFSQLGEKEKVITYNEELNINIQSCEVTKEELEEEAYYDSLELLALCVEAEAENQGLLGKKYVVDVVLNRVDDEDFPDDITGVILQENQFSVVTDGRIWKAEPTEETFQAVREELESRTNSEVLYFTCEGFSPYGEDWKKIGDHYFSTKKEGE